MLRSPLHALAGLFLAVFVPSCHTSDPAYATPQTAPPTIEALRYDVVIYEGSVAALHGTGQNTQELFFPSRGVYCAIERTSITDEYGSRTPALILHAHYGQIRNTTTSPRTGTSTTSPTQSLAVPASLAKEIFELADLTIRLRRTAADLGSRLSTARLLR